MHVEEDSLPIEKILIEMTPIVRGLARALAPSDPTLREDLVQEGFLSLVLASSSYDPVKGPFSAFARRCARNRMISYLRRLRPSLPLTDEDLEALSFEPDSEEDIDIRLAAKSLFSLLSPFELACMEAFLYTGSAAGASEVLGWQQKKVENALTRIRGKARMLRENPFQALEPDPSGQETDLSLQ